MPKRQDDWVSTCVLCGNADEVGSMTEVALEHHSAVWPERQLLCSRCCLAVMDAVRRELDIYNSGVSNDADLQFGLGGSDDPVDSSATGNAVGGAPALADSAGAGVDSGKRRKAKPDRGVAGSPDSQS